MAVKKISISLEAEVFEQAKHAAETEGIALSALARLGGRVPDRTHRCAG